MCTGRSYLPQGRKKNISEQSEKFYHRVEKGKYYLLRNIVQIVIIPASDEMKIEPKYFFLNSKNFKELCD